EQRSNRRGIVLARSADNRLGTWAAAPGPIIGGMRPTDFPPRWRVSGDSGIAPLGPAMTTLRSVVARLASLVRCAGIPYIAVQVAVRHSFYTAGPWRLAGPVAASVWAAAVTIYLRRRWPAGSWEPRAV